MENDKQKNENIEAVEEMQTVGGILRNARLKQGKTLNDVATDLCIRRVYLEAIENVEYKKLPTEPYGLGYVRNYAEYLGLNGARIVQSFKETAMPKINGKKSLKAIGDEVDGNGPAFKHVIIGIFVLFAALLAWNFYNHQDKKPNIEIINETPSSDDYPTPVILDEPESETSAEPEENSDISAEKTSDIKDVDEIKNETENTASDEIQAKKDDLNSSSNASSADNVTTNRIKLVVTGDSWIELKHENEVLLAKIYHKGFEYEVPYNENLEVSVGKRENVQFYIDGKLTQVATPQKKLKIKLDNFLEKR